MKKINVVASAILMGASFGALATPPSVPTLYGSGPLKASSPKLFASEKAAFAAMEGALQEAEAIIYQGGCAAASGGKSRTWDVSTNVDDSGTGTIDVSSNGVLQFELAVSGGKNSQSPVGSSYKTNGSAGNVLNGNSLPAYTSTAYYSAGGDMMVQDATFQVKNVNNNFDRLSGTVIKDFYKEGAKNPTPVIWDWGLQSVSKNSIPQDKWWQRSKATRSDGDFAYTRFVKDRLFSAKNGGVCNIEISTSGINDADGFYQDGTLTISKAGPKSF